jgi:hypothetical protein
MAVPKAARIERDWTCFRLIHREFEKVRNDSSSNNILRTMFGFESMDWAHFDYYQSKPEREIRIANNQIPVKDLRAKVMTTFGRLLSQNCQNDIYSGMLSLPLLSKRWIAMNEEISIYAIMYFVSELIRYHSDYLEAVNSGWILKSFVESCPLRFLRIMTSRIYGYTIRITHA